MKNKSLWIPCFVLLAAVAFIPVFIDMPDSGIAIAKEDCGCSVSLNEFASMGNRKGDRKKADSLNKQGLALHKKKQYCQAVKIWCQAAEIDPSYWKPFFNISCAQALLGNIDRSFDYAELALVRDRSKALRPFKRDGDLKSLRKYGRYQKILSMHEGMSFQEAVNALDKALRLRDAGVLKTVIHSDEGLKFEGDSGSDMYNYLDIDSSVMNKMPDDIGSVDKNGRCGTSSDSVRFYYHQSDYTQDPPSAAPRCEGWNDNCLEFRKIGAGWHLFKYTKTGNGGC